MSLEQKIEELTAAVVALTAKMSGASAESKAEVKAEKTEKKVEKKAAAYEPKHTAEEMQAAMNSVREKLGMPVAKEMRAAHTKAEKINQVTDPKEIDALYEAATKALEAAAEEDV